MRLTVKQLAKLLVAEKWLPRVVNLTEEIKYAQDGVYTLPTGESEEPWEDYVDFKQYSLDYDIALVGGKYYCIGKFVLGEEVDYE